MLCVPGLWRNFYRCACFPKIFVSASLTRLNVGFNNLREEGEAALRKAIEGRSGFELLL